MISPQEAKKNNLELLNQTFLKVQGIIDTKLRREYYGEAITVHLDGPLNKGVRIRIIDEYYAAGWQVKYTSSHQYNETVENFTFSEK